MAFCGKCGSHVDNYANVCPSCGQTVNAPAQGNQPSAQYAPQSGYGQPQGGRPLQHGGPLRHGGQPVGYPASATEVPRISDYIIMWLVLAIPLVNLMFLIIWAIGGSSTPLWKTNYARAYFVLIAIGFVVGIVIGALFFAALASCISDWADILVDISY